ncbi:hypothetical protein BTR23_10905 [Alkalihalophilus pseudofirmus]|nr:hypothetical protein BTR23_10905 [Alkalihalophilus pseudofirmus]
MIQFTKVHKQYGDRFALKDINFSIHGGVCFGLIGLNGEGKSNLIEFHYDSLKRDSVNPVHNLVEPCSVVYGFRSN